MDKWEEMRKYLVFELNRALEEREGPYAHPSLSTAMLMQENTIQTHAIHGRVGPKRETRKEDEIS